MYRWRGRRERRPERATVHLRLLPDFRFYVVRNGTARELSDREVAAVTVRAYIPKEGEVEADVYAARRGPGIDESWNFLRPRFWWEYLALLNVIL